MVDFSIFKKYNVGRTFEAGIIKLMTENELLLNSISAFLKGERITAPKETDWQELIQKAEQQKLLPAVYEVLGASMPESVQRACKASVACGLIAQSQRTAEFLKAYSELGDAGISPLVIKGIICRSTYDKPDYRTSSDEDLFVPAENYPAFHAKMLELGFEAAEPDYKNAHEQRYFRNGLMIEGHWKLFPQTSSTLDAFNSYTEEFCSRAQTVTVDGTKIKTLEPTDHMIFLLFHAYKHFINSGVGIRQICDIAQWSKHFELDWQRVHRAMKSICGEYFAAAIFDAGEKYFGMKFPDAWERADCKALLDDALDGGIYGSADMSRKHSGPMTIEAVEAGGKGKRGAPLVKAVFPNRAVMETSYPWVKKSAALLPAAWCARIFRYISNGPKDGSASESIRIGTERIELLRQYGILK